MKKCILRGANSLDSIDCDDRGLNYGDGVFETILVHHGRLVWWHEHWQRLMLGAKMLGIPVPEQAHIERQCEQLVAGSIRAVLKLVLTCGSGGRGYLAPENPVPTVILSLHDAPVAATQPITVRWCETSLAVQPLLAGFKHLNRLEQVLARAEWRDTSIFEGLLCDTEGRVVCATAANVFIRHQGHWLTPRVDRCGIAGIARGWLLGHVEGVLESDFGPDVLMAAEAFFLCNAVRGILPVGRLANRQWQADAEIGELQQRLAQAEPAFKLGE